jgi:hypothetical protein
MTSQEINEKIQEMVNESKDKEKAISEKMQTDWPMVAQTQNYCELCQSFFEALQDC